MIENLARSYPVPNGITIPQAFGVATQHLVSAATVVAFAGLAKQRHCPVP
jgi:hypothetical protein